MPLKMSPWVPTNRSLSWSLSSSFIKCWPPAPDFCDHLGLEQWWAICHSWAAKKVTLALLFSDFENLQKFLHYLKLNNTFVSLGTGAAKEPEFFLLLFLWSSGIFLALLLQACLAEVMHKCTECLPFPECRCQLQNSSSVLTDETGWYRVAKRQQIREL